MTNVIGSQLKEGFLKLLQHWIKVMTPIRTHK